MEEQSLFEKLSDSQFNKYMKYFFTIVDDDFDDIQYRLTLGPIIPL
jgi:hypothetical protein